MVTSTKRGPIGWSPNRSEILLQRSENVANVNGPCRSWWPFKSDFTAVSMYLCCELLFLVCIHRQNQHNLYVWSSSYLLLFSFTHTHGHKKIVNLSYSQFISDSNSQNKRTKTALWQSKNTKMFDLAKYIKEHATKLTNYTVHSTILFLEPPEMLMRRKNLRF